MNTRPSGSLLFMTAMLLAAAISMQSPVAAKDKSHHQTIWSFGDDSHGDFAFILVEKGGDEMSGTAQMQDYAEAGKLGKTSDQALLWAQLDGEHYVIRDKATVGRARKAMEPLKAVSDQQARLGDQQAKLGEQQERLGQRQERLGQRQVELGQRQARLSEEIVQREGRGSPTDDLQRELDAARDESENLSRQQNDLGQQQNTLSRQHEPLSRQQRALGEQAGKLSRALNDDIEALVREAVKSGLAAKQS